MLPFKDGNQNFVHKQSNNANKIYSQAYPTYKMQTLTLHKETLDQMDRIQIDFQCKRDKSNSRGGYIIYWDSICRLIAQGRPGIKSTHHFNIVLLKKMTSRIIMDRDQLWEQLLEAKYFLNVDPLGATRSSNLSWIWMSIQKG